MVSIKKKSKFSDCYVFYDKLCDNYYYIDFYNSNTVFSIGNEFKITQDLYITRIFNMYKIYKIIKVIFRDFLKPKQNNKTLGKKMKLEDFVIKIFLIWKKIKLPMSK